MPLSELISRGLELLLWGAGALFATTSFLVFFAKGIVRWTAHHADPLPALVPVRCVSRTARERARLAAVTAAVHHHHARWR